MKHKTSFTTALIALGLISAASAAPIEIHITGSTAFRGNFFNACNQAGASVFDSQPTILPAGANGSSSLITYVGNIGGVQYALECSWTGSEAGIANVAGVATLNNPGLPNGPHPTAGTLPGATTTFPDVNGVISGSSFTGQGDLTLADTSQAVSLTKPPAQTSLHDYGTVGIVTFTWLKGKNSTGSAASADPGDAAWGRLVNVTQPQMLYALGGSVPASLLTGNANDGAIPTFIVGRNAGSGTRVNTLLDTFYGVQTAVSQLALNSTYAGANGDVLTYKVVSGNQAATYPLVSASLASSNPNATPNALGVGNDGYESGSGVSKCLSCDQTGSEVLILGYAGLGDAKDARDGNNTSNPPQPGGAVWLNLDGNPMDDALVVNGTYSFWGHEHLYGRHTPSGNANTVAAKIISGIAANGGLGTGVSGAKSSGIAVGSMAADKPSDSGYPFPL